MKFTVHDSKTAGRLAVALTVVAVLCAASAVVVFPDGYTDAETSSMQDEIENAAAGSVIEIAGEETFSKTLTIGKGVTVEVLSSGSLKAEAGITVIGTLVNDGSMSISGTFDIKDDGEVVDNSADTVYAEGAKVVIEGVLDTEATLESRGVTDVQAAMYTDSGRYVYTDVATAVVLGGMSDDQDVTVYGDVSADRLDVREGLLITVEEGSSLTAKAVCMQGDSSVFVIEGAVFSAEVTVQYGGEEVAVFGLDGIKGAGFGTILEASTSGGDHVVKLTQFDDGALDVKSGKLVYTGSFGNIETSADGKAVATPMTQKVSVSEDATVVLLGSCVVGDAEGKDLFFNDGNVEVAGDLTMYDVVVTGKVRIDKGAVLTLSGSDTKRTAEVAVYGYIFGEEGSKIVLHADVDVGSMKEPDRYAASIVGDLEIKETDATGSMGQGSHSLIAFGPSCVTDTNPESAMVSTTYVVNDRQCFTMFIDDEEEVVIGEISRMALRITPGADMDQEVKWKADGEDVTDAMVGEYPVVYAKVKIVTAADTSYNDWLVPVMVAVSAVVGLFVAFCITRE